MRRWFLRIQHWLEDFWKKSSLIRKIVVAGVGVLVLGSLLFVGALGVVPKRYPLLRTVIESTQTLDAIQLRLDQSGVVYTISAGIIYLNSAQEARRMRDVLIREDLLPKDIDPWAVFDMERWTITDFERNINLQRAIAQKLELHIRALNDVDSVKLNLVMPKTELFKEQQAEVRASVTLVAKPGSDLYTNQQKLQGIQKLIQYAVQGLTDDNIVITDHQGNQINDFTQGSIDDRLRQAHEQLHFKERIERHYRRAIETQLSSIYGQSRIKIINLDVNLDMTQKTTKAKEIKPIILKERTPGLPYDDGQVVQSITIEEQSESISYRGMGSVPEGPLGIESQIAPSYQEVNDLAGEYTKENAVKHYVTNQVDVVQEGAPWELKSIHIGVAVDGQWRLERNAKGGFILDPETASLKREYIPVDEQALQSIESVVQASISFVPIRGDTISVQHIPFDRAYEHFIEDEQYFRSLKIQSLLYYMMWGIVGGLFLLVLAYFLWPHYRRLINHRRKRLKELEEAAAKQAPPSVYSDEEKAMLDQFTLLAKRDPKVLADALRYFTEKT